MINQENGREFLTLKLIIMKKLGKLEINSEKLMKNEELLILRGGYGDCHCVCYSRDPIPVNKGIMAAENEAECDENCDEMGWDGNWNCLPG